MIFLCMGIIAVVFLLTVGGLYFCLSALLRGERERQEKKPERENG